MPGRLAAISRGSAVGFAVGMTRHSPEVKLPARMAMYSSLLIRPTPTLYSTSGSWKIFASFSRGVPRTWRHTVSPRLAASAVM